MKIIFTISILFIFSFSFAQNSFSLDSIQSFSWTSSVVYLPSVQSELEEYLFKREKLHRNYSDSKKNKRKKITEEDKQIVFEAYNHFTQSIKLDTITIVLSRNDKDSLIAMSQEKSIYGVPIYSASLQDVKKNIISDTLNIDTREFSTKNNDHLQSPLGLVVIDGAPFKIRLKINLKNNKELEYTYVGNLFDHVNDTCVKEFLIFYKIYQNATLFKDTPLKDYFSKKQLYTVIMRYIAYKERLIDKTDYFQMDNK